MTIAIADLLPGDLVFDFTGTSETRPGLVDDVPDGSARMTHVSMVTAVDQGAGFAHHVHQVNRGLSGTLRSDLIPALKEVGGVAAARQSLQRVVRCTRGDLRGRAAELGALWANYQMPFAEYREGNAEAMEKACKGAGGLVALQRALFARYGKYRAMKYAARREGMLSYPNEEHAGQGMFCSMFVAVCYQVAGIEPLVTAAGTAPDIRVSDKKMRPSDLDDAFDGLGARYHDRVRYTSYVQGLHSLDPYGFKPDAQARARAGKTRIERSEGVSYTPSICFWNFDRERSIENVNWARYLTRGMQLDCKVIHPTGLYLCLADDPKDWQDLGILAGPGAYSESREERDARLKAHRLGSEDQRRMFLAKRF